MRRPPMIQLGEHVNFWYRYGIYLLVFNNFLENAYLLLSIQSGAALHNYHCLLPPAPSV